MWARGTLGKDALALQLKRLDAAFLFGVRRDVAAGDGFRARRGRSAFVHGLLLCLLPFDGLAFPSTRHGSILLPIALMHMKFHGPVGCL